MGELGPRVFYIPQHNFVEFSATVDLLPGPLLGRTL
jgi:hypothetical protein